MPRYGLQRIGFAVAALAVGCFIRPSEAGSSSITYDLAGRVTSALYDNGMCVLYSYDANGNRTSQTNAIPSGTPTWGTSVYGCVNWTP
jgi:YD repeat-containing protein